MSSDNNNPPTVKKQKSKKLASVSVKEYDYVFKEKIGIQIVKHYEDGEEFYSAELVNVCKLAESEKELVYITPTNIVTNTPEEASMIAAQLCSELYSADILDTVFVFDVKNFDLIKKLSLTELTEEEEFDESFSMETASPSTVLH